ncbi:hypothetical protein GHT09_009038 [Marmota monax]|uniref:Uncharacterized protein n=1 Tax=Marmota monax TaxID=9995 RepID=A0A834V1V9_MARMO|nr:hypothetical protein GHT09_009038 [Marmota monax]
MVTVWGRDANIFEHAQLRTRTLGPPQQCRRTTIPRSPLGVAAPPPAVALPPSPPSGSALLLDPSPPSERVSVTQRQCEAEEPSGGAAAAAASSSSNSNNSSSSNSSSRAARPDLSVALRERSTKRARASRSLRGSSALGSAVNFASWGLADWRGRRRRNARLSARAPRARTLHPHVLGLGGRTGIPATSSCPEIMQKVSQGS